ncbi:uncharacterized protein LOC106083872 [Stomoxys calcitrans]|uniref:Hemolymph juvenile hormone binding protein n=1 Tax=Stomoxys calcitrans TaxID=35570 RepID=A0A1I8P636_STOCA|nr:uncharacterized protein LOC106083872 [Stomoxys calcitrans]
MFKLLTTFATILVVFLNTCQPLATIEGYIAPEGRTKFDDDLRDFVEFIKLQMKCGYEPAGIPPLAPFEKEFTKFNIVGSMGSFKGNLTNLIITGLNEFDIVDLNWNNVLQKITFDFRFPSIWAKSSYKLNVLTNMLGPVMSLHGDGLFNLELINLRAHGSFKLRPNLSGGLTVWAFNIKLDLESSKSKTTGFMDSVIYSKIFNSWAEEFIRLTFDENAEGVSDTVEYLVVPPMNKALQNISMVELVALIMGLAQDVIPSEAIC